MTTDPSNNLGSRKCARIVGDKYGVAVAASTLRRKIREMESTGKPLDQISFGRKGRTSYFSDESYNALKNVFLTSICLQQVSNEPEISAVQWKGHMTKLLRKAANGRTSGKSLYERLSRDELRLLSSTSRFFSHLDTATGSRAFILYISCFL